MILGCIDIGSNTTRLLVAEAGDGPLRELTAERVFTCIRKSLDGGGRIPPEKVAETVRVVGAQARRAHDLGATAIVAVATAAIRDAPNRDELERGVEDALGVPLRVISGEEEARLSFVGATRTLSDPATGTVAVVDVGGGSTEMAVGSPDGHVEWWSSLPVGSGLLADRHLRSDPPTAEEIDAVRRQVAAALDGLAVPVVDSAVAVGGTATSLARVLGAALDHEALERGIELLSQAPIAELASRLSLDPERVRLLPAGILVLQAVSDRLGPLQIARGGLREGVLLEQLEQAGPRS
jgi:exopolyphosphatase/guanosine-5'-triphosphate,3'-diphosphate pyrophosphatase